MAKKIVKYKQKQLWSSKLASQNTASVFTGDSFVNPLLNLGVGSSNALKYGRYVNAVQENNNRQKLSAMYSCNLLARRLVEMEAEDMTREGIEITGDIDPKKTKQMYAYWANLSVQRKLFNAISMARLYGGSIAYMHIEGQRIDTPLDISSIRKDQFKGLKVFDRWQLLPSINDVDFLNNTPMYYGILTPLDQTIKFRTQSDFDRVYSQYNSGFKIHASRVIRFDGDYLPDVDYVANQLWHSSILVNLMDLLTNYNTAASALAAASYKASFRVVKVDGLMTLLNQGPDGQAYKNLQDFISAMRIAESSENITVVNATDDVNVVNYDLSGMIAAIEEFKDQISGMGYPGTKLFGESAQGLNSSGDNETRMYYDQVKAAQEEMRSDVMKLLQVSWRSKFGNNPPDDMNFEYVPLWQIDPNEKATIAQQLTDSITKTYDSGLVSKSVALEELLQSSETTGVWSNISSEDIEKAQEEDADPPSPDETMMSTEQVNALMNAQNNPQNAQTQNAITSQDKIGDTANTANTENAEENGENS